MLDRFVHSFYFHISVELFVGLIILFELICIHLRTLKVQNHFSGFYELKKVDGMFPVNQ